MGLKFLWRVDYAIVLMLGEVGNHSKDFRSRDTIRVWGPLRMRSGFMAALLWFRV